MLAAAEMDSFFRNFIAALQSPVVAALDSFMKKNNATLECLLRDDVPARRVIDAVLENGDTLNVSVFARMCPVPFCQFYPRVREVLKKHAQSQEGLARALAFLVALEAATNGGPRDMVAIGEAQTDIFALVPRAETGVGALFRLENVTPPLRSPRRTATQD